MIEVYEVGSAVAISGGSVGVVEKVVIGANNSICYQLICYHPDRHMVIVNDFEVTPVEGKVEKRNIGFAQVVIAEKKEVSVFVDEKNCLVGFDAPREILIGVTTMSSEQVAEYCAHKESRNVQG